MDSARRSRGTASDEDYEDGLYTDYSHNGDGDGEDDGEDEDEEYTYPYVIRRYLYDPQAPLHRLHLASFSDSLQYRGRVPGEMPPWRFQDGVESPQPLRRNPRDRRRRRRRRSSTSTMLSEPSYPQSASSTSTSVVSLNPALIPMPSAAAAAATAAASSDPDSREPSSSFQGTLPPPPPAPYQPPPENPAADVPTSPSRDEDRAVGHGDGPGIDRQGSGGDAEQQAAIWGRHQIIHDSGPFVIEGNDPDTSNSVDWDWDWDWDAADIENWTPEKLDAEFEAFERQKNAAE